MVYRRIRKMVTCPLDESLFCELVLVSINSLKGGIKLHTSGWGAFLLTSRGGLTGAFDLALSDSGNISLVTSPPVIESAREGLEVLSF